MTMNDTDKLKQFGSQEKCKVQDPDEILFWKKSGKAVKDPRIYIPFSFGIPYCRYLISWIVTVGSGESIKSPGSEVGGAHRYVVGRWLVEGCDTLCAGMQQPGKPVRVSSSSRVK